MNSTPSENNTGSTLPEKKKNYWRKAVRISVWILVSFISLIIGAAILFTLWLTPDRLSKIISTETSKYLKADVYVRNPRFTIWTSFPWLTLETDSIIITSHSLDSIPASQKNLIPTDASRLISARSFNGDINIIKAISSRFHLRDVKLSGLRVNLVALNDSTANYLILRTVQNGPEEVPYFTANSIKLADTGRIDYYSAADTVRGLVTLENPNLVRSEKGKNSYTLRFPGKVSADYHDITLVRDFPFSLVGDIAFDFHPFACRLSDFNIALGNIKGKVNLDLLVGENPAIRHFDYSVERINIRNLLRFIPGLPALTGLSPDIFSQISDITSDLNIGLSARLIGPYKFSPDALPSVDVNVDVAPGNLSFNLDNGRQINLGYERLSASFLFDGKNPDASRLAIAPFGLTAPGVECLIDAKVKDVMTDPYVEADIRADADIAGVLSALGLTREYPVSGRAGLDSHLGFNLSKINSTQLLATINSVSIRGNATLDNLHGRIPAQGINFGADGISLAFDNSSGNAKLDFKAGNLAFFAPRESVKLKASRLDIKADVPVNGTPLESGTRMAMRSGPLTLEFPDFSYSGKSLAISSSTSAESRRSFPTLPLPQESPDASDARTLRIQEHSPVMLSTSVPEGFKDIMRRLRFNMNIKAADGLLRTSSFPVANYLKRFDASLSFDTINIRKLAMRSQSSGMNISGKLTNLRQFLTSPQPAILKADFDIALDTVQINQLARAYESGVALKKGTAALLPAKKTITRSDSIAVLIPRNLDADIRLSAMETVYTNLHLYDLGASVKLSKGNAHISNLSISSDFCHAAANVAFNSGNLQNYGIDADVALTDIDIVEFFKNFHTLLLMMPQMKNLKGNIGLELDAHMPVFPNMYINVPGMTADISAQGRGLTVHQDPFIRKITRMMLIHTDDDIHIKNIEAKATVHDNLLELYPFDFQFDGYKLNMVGVNNFNGRLYYHIGLMESPLHIPFGINIEGMFSHPKLRFGGATFKVNKAREVTSRVMESNNVNMLSELKYYLRVLVEKAADADTSDNSQYLYHVPDYRAERKGVTDSQK